MTAARAEAILARGAGHLDVLRMVALAGPAGAWVGAGFLRTAVWDALTGRRAAVTDLGDIDVIHLDPARPDAARDKVFGAALRAARPALAWSVTNEARMAMRHGHPPYANIKEAIAARLSAGAVEMMAPHGLDDLFALAVQPTPAHVGDARVVRARVAAKQWRARWPGLRMFNLDGD